MTPPNRPPLLPDDYTFVETEPYEKGFADYYRDHILPLVMKYEPQRRIRNKTQYAQMALGLGAGLASSWAILKSAWFAKMMAHSRNGKAGNIILFPPFFFWWLFVHRARRSYFTRMKEEICPLILSYMGEFSYASVGVIDDGALTLHGLYNPAFFNLLYCEDVIEYKEGGATVRILERVFWDIKKPVGSIFIHFVFPNPKKIDALIFSKVNYEGYKAKKKGILSKRKNIKKYDEAGNFFDESFEIYVADTHTIDDWLTLGLTRNLLELNEVFDRKGLICSIRENQMLVELESHGNFFEPGRTYDRPALNASDIKKHLGELHFAIEIATLLNEQARLLP